MNAFWHSPGADLWHICVYFFARCVCVRNHRCQFRDFHGIWSHQSLQMPPRWGLDLWGLACYTNAVPTGLKSPYSHRILQMIRKVFPPENALLVVKNTPIFLKLTLMVRLCEKRCEKSQRTWKIGQAPDRNCPNFSIYSSVRNYLDTLRKRVGNRSSLLQAS